MDSKKIVYAALAALIAIALIVLLIKIVSGAFTLLNGTFNTIIGLIVIIALVVIVIWMFRYASKH
jgi:hypothetical protein